MNKLSCNKCKRSWYVDQKDLYKVIVCPYCKEIVEVSPYQVEDIVQGIFLLLRHRKEKKYIANFLFKLDEDFVDELNDELSLSDNELNEIIPVSENEIKEMFKILMAEDKSEKIHNENNSDKLFEMGLDYYFKNRMIASKKEAAKCFIQAAEQGHLKSQNNIAVMYKLGEGVQKSFDKALEWFTKAAESGDYVAQYNLGNLYQEVGAIRSECSAIKWYKKAAEQWIKCKHGQIENRDEVMWKITDTESYSDFIINIDEDNEEFYTAKAMFERGCCYYSGIGTSVSYEKAFYWYTKAAKLGYAKAQNNLGVMFSLGQGVTQSYIDAYKCYGNSDPMAKYNLGLIYQNGWGRAANNLHAALCFKKASEYGLPKEVKKSDDTGYILYSCQQKE